MPGIGRWGMMHVYFGDSAMWEAPPIHVEIQPTGWLLDGGVPLWITMGAALAAGLRASYLVAVRADGSLQESGTAILCLQLTLLAICLSGPAFNTQLGHPVLGADGRAVGTGAGRRGAADSRRGACRVCVTGGWAGSSPAWASAISTR